MARISWTTHTATSEIPLDVEYVCSNCKRLVLVTHYVKESASKATSPNGGSAQLTEKLKNDASEALKKRMSKIIEEYNVGKYDAAGFNIKCPHCSRKEPWSKLSAPRTGCLFSVIGILCILAGIYEALTGYLFDGFAAILFGVGCLVANCFIDRLFRKIHYSQIAKLPKESLPKIRRHINNPPPRNFPRA